MGLTLTFSPSVFKILCINFFILFYFFKELYIRNFSCSLYPCLGILASLSVMAEAHIRSRVVFSASGYRLAVLLNLDSVR